MVLEKFDAEVFAMIESGVLYGGKGRCNQIANFSHAAVVCSCDEAPFECTVMKGEGVMCGALVAFEGGIEVGICGVDSVWDGEGCECFCDGRVEYIKCSVGVRDEEEVRAIKAL